MIKVLFLIDGISGGGAEKVLCNLVNNMDQSKFDITVQTFDEYNPEEYLVAGIHYKSINRCKSKLGKKLFSYWFRLCAELKMAYYFFVKDNYDIEIAYLETMPTKIIAQSTNKKAKKLAWVHCDLSKKEGMEESKKKIRKQYIKFDKIICVSEDARKGFYKLCGNDFDAIVLHNVIDEEEILKKAEESITDWQINSGETQLLAVGRLTQQKNFGQLIRACGLLRDYGYKFHLNILGEGPERNNLQTQINELELNHEITLRGFTSNPYPWMKMSDIIVCSSKYEGISTVVQEALILGKIVVTTPCTGMRELLGDSQYGLIVDDNSTNGLYDGISRMLESQNKVDKYTNKALNKGLSYRKKNTVNKTERLFETIIDKDDKKNDRC